MAEDQLTKSSNDGLSLLVIGGSAGSLTVVLQMLPYFEKIEIAVIVVFHRKAGDAQTVVDLFSSRTTYEVKEIDDKDTLRTKAIFIAPPEYHVLIEKDNTLTLDDSERVNYSRPSIDITFESASEVFGNRMACMLLSGANADGVAGLKIAQRRRASVIIQDPSTAEVSYMPEQAMDAVKPDFIYNPAANAELFDYLASLIKG
jgi:two-component system, chemotaxis family, protein-glutamate methylesterase/glutaminase